MRPIGAVLAFATMTGAVALASCTEGGTSPSRAASVSLSIAGVAGPGGAALHLSDGSHTLGIDGVALVVSEVALAAGDVEEALERGPFVLEVPVDGGVRSLMAAVVPPARYDGVRIDLHVPRRADPADAVFLESHPEFEGASVRVEGRWDGEPFVWTRAVDELRFVVLSPPVDVRGRTANVTLRLDVGAWFRDDDGALVEPGAATGDGPVAAAVESRIRASFEAFEDPDADGTASGG